MPTYDFRCLECDAVFEVFRPMSEADNAAPCPESPRHETLRIYGVAEAYMRDRAPVRKAQVRKGDYWQAPGTITDHIVTGDGNARMRETERQLLTIAKENGISAGDNTLVMKGDPPKPRGRRLISFPGKPARTMTRRDRN